MTSQGLFHLTLFAFATLVLYGWLPAAAARSRDRPPLSAGPAAWLILWILPATVVLGLLQMCYPALLALVYSAGLFLIHLGGIRRLPMVEDRNAAIALAKPLEVLDLKFWAKLHHKIARTVSLRVRQVIDLGLVFGAAAWLSYFELGHVRFRDIRGYEETLSLHLLTYRADWQVDPTAAVLAPLAQLAGLPNDVVVRFAPAFFIALTAAASGALATVLSRSPAAGYLSGVATIVGTRLFDPQWGAGESLLSYFWMSAVLQLARKRIAAAPLAAIGLAFSAGSSGGVFAVALGSALAIGAVTRLIRRAEWPLEGTLRLGAATAAACAVLALPAPAPPLLEYEAAARQTKNIARSFPRNRWLIVSPYHDLSFLFGRGWHMELSEWVRLCERDNLGDPSFHFPWDFDNIFVFIEKRPVSWLNQRVDINGPMAGRLFRLDAGAYAYSSPIGRTDLQFRAANMMMRFAASHPNVSSFYEDNDIAVYRIPRSPPQRH